jgi:hypothetical protein
MIDCPARGCLIRESVRICDVPDPKHLLRTSLVGTILTINSGHTPAQQPDPFAQQKATFYSADILQGATQDISQMSEPELRSFVHYLSECEDEGSGDVALHECIVAEQEYTLEYAQLSKGKYLRPIDKFMSARSMLINRPATEKIRDDDFADVNKMIEQTTRYARIVSAIDDAARARFLVLKASKK